MNRFIIDLHDPHYVSTLYNTDRPEGEPPIKIGMNVKKDTSEPLVVNKPHTNAGSRISNCN